MSLFPVFSPAATASVGTVNHVASPVSTANASSYTFSSTAIGTAAVNRTIVVGFMSSGGAIGQIEATAMTIGGVSAARQAFEQPSIEQTLEIWSADVPTGTSADIVVTMSEASDRAAIDVWDCKSINKTASATDGATGQPVDTLTNTTTVKASGVMVGMARFSATSTTFTNLTEDSDRQVETTSYAGAASDAFAELQTSRTITLNPAGTVDCGLVTAAFDAA
jgi:hypothetical protein